MSKSTFVHNSTPYLLHMVSHISLLFAHTATKWCRWAETSSSSWYSSNLIDQCSCTFKVLGWCGSHSLLFDQPYAIISFG